MGTRFCSSLATAVFVLAAAVSPGPACGQEVLLSSFEGDLSSSIGVDWVDPQTPLSLSFVSEGNTEGSMALRIGHTPEWDHDYLVLVGGVPLAEITAESEFLAIDVTTVDIGEAGDGRFPEWRQLFLIFNSNEGGWMQNQLDFPVASDDGGSHTETLFVDLVASGITGHAENYVASGGGAGTWWEIFMILQGADAGPVIAAGDYNDDGSVDAADYTVWRDNLGGTMLPNETATPGIVDEADYDEWKAHFGSTPGRIHTIIDNVRFLSTSGLGVSTVVPEPSTLILAWLMVGLGVLLRLRPAR